MTFIIRLTAVMIIGLYGFAMGQSRDNYNMWFQYLMTGKISDKSTLTALTQYRSFDLAYDTRLFLLNAYIDFEVTRDVKVAPGAMFLVLESYADSQSKKIRFEKRPFQQITLDHLIGRSSLYSRLRVEERFLSNPNEIIVRLRYLLSLRIPLNGKGGNEKLYGILKDEIRMNMVRDEPFDSNRITAGLGIKLGRNSQLELALINQLEIGKTSNYGFIGFRNSFDWRKKEKQ